MQKPFDSTRFARATVEVMRRLVVVLMLLAIVTAPPVRAQPTRIDDALARIVAENGLPGAVAVVLDNGVLTRHTAGSSDVATGAGFAPNTHVRVGSLAKMLVAATVLQLVGDGRIDLDQSIETYLPGRVRGDGIDASAITVRELLRHQSGLPEYFDSVTAIPTEPVTGEQLLDMALTRPAQFAAGTAMKYTNTNYMVAGLIIEAVTGAPAAEEVIRRTATPLGLVDTYFPAPADTGLREPFAHGYELRDGRLTDVTDFNASAAGMSGALVSTAEDMSTFVAALLDGRVIAPSLLQEMMVTVPQSGADPAFRYGLGLGSIDLSCGVTVWGHGGDVPGYHTLAVAPLDGPALSVAVTADAPSESGLDEPVVRLAEAFYCH